MPIREPIRQLQRWASQSLANTFALRAAQIAIASSLMVALISLILIYWIEKNTLEARLLEKSQRVAERVETAVGIIESSASDLSRNPMFMTALLDEELHPLGKSRNSLGVVRGVFGERLSE